MTSLSAASPGNPLMCWRLITGWVTLLPSYTWPITKLVLTGSNMLQDDLSNEEWRLVVKLKNLFKIQWGVSPSITLNSTHSRTVSPASRWYSVQTYESSSFMELRSWLLRLKSDYCMWMAVQGNCLGYWWSILLWPEICAFLLMLGSPWWFAAWKCSILICAIWVEEIGYQCDLHNLRRLAE